jgi:hypothetical protein
VNRGYTVARCHRRAVAPEQAVTEAECIGQPIVADLPEFAHLRVVLAFPVDPDQHVEHHLGKTRVALIVVTIGPRTWSSVFRDARSHAFFGRRLLLEQRGPQAKQTNETAK